MYNVLCFSLTRDFCLYTKKVLTFFIMLLKCILSSDEIVLILHYVHYGVVAYRECSLFDWSLRHVTRNPSAQLSFLFPFIEIIEANKKFNWMLNNTNIQKM